MGSYNREQKYSRSRSTQCILNIIKLPGFSGHCLYSNKQRRLCRSASGTWRASLWRGKKIHPTVLCHFQVVLLTIITSLTPHSVFMTFYLSPLLQINARFWHHVTYGTGQLFRHGETTKPHKQWVLSGALWVDSTRDSQRKLHDHLKCNSACHVQ